MLLSATHETCCGLLPVKGKAQPLYRIKVSEARKFLKRERLLLEQIELCCCPQQDCGEERRIIKSCQLS